MLEARYRLKIKLSKLLRRREHEDLRHDDGNTQLRQQRHIGETVPECFVAITPPMMRNKPGVVPIKDVHFPFELQGSDKPPILGYFYLKAPQII